MSRHRLTPQIARSSASPVAEDRALRTVGPVLPPDTAPGRSTQVCLACHLLYARGDGPCGDHRSDSGNALLSLVLPVGFLGTILVTLAVGSGHGAYLLTHLAKNMPQAPPLNGATLLGFLAVMAYTCHRLSRIDTPTVDQLLDPEYDDGYTDGNPCDEPWFSTEPAELTRTPAPAPPPHSRIGKPRHRR